MDEIETKIKHCVKCNKTFTSNTHYLIHCETELHKTGKRKIRADRQEELKCTICNLYSTKQHSTLKIHILNNHSSIEEKKKEYKYYCEYCNIGYLVEDKFNIHLDTLKHKIKISTLNNLIH